MSLTRILYAESLEVCSCSLNIVQSLNFSDVSSPSVISSPSTSKVNFMQFSFNENVTIFSGLKWTRSFGKRKWFAWVKSLDAQRRRINSWFVKCYNTAAIHWYEYYSLNAFHNASSTMVSFYEFYGKFTFYHPPSPDDCFEGLSFNKIIVIRSWLWAAVNRNAFNRKSVISISTTLNFKSLKPFQLKD